MHSSVAVMPDGTRLSVRPMADGDLAQIVKYWSELSAEDSARMGVRASKIPPAPDYLKTLRSLVGLPLERTPAFYMMWEVNGTAIGFSSLKNIAINDRGDMHLHMWAAPQRGKGFGAVLFCMSALEFYRIFNLREIICEPKASNPMPNRMLQKIGFPLLLTHVAASSELSEVCELNRYGIRPDIARTYLSGAVEVQSV